MVICLLQIVPKNAKKDDKPIENYICVLSGHPYAENILLTADYDGKVLSLIGVN